jgi:anaerobic carbon-monoxide dehydrogenase iron sulfur subunit
VLVDQTRCIACAMCAIVCPFDAVTFHPAAGNGDGHPVATKCDGCVHRVKQGLEPACVEVCKVDALVYGEVNELVGEAGRGMRHVPSMPWRRRRPGREGTPRSMRGAASAPR